jgi:hypothetical protein
VELGIDQNNPTERNHQVALMGRIYSTAQQVFIWLGPEQNHSNLVLETIGRGVFTLAPEDFLNSLELLLRRDWFGRVWVGAARM